MQGQHKLLSRPDHPFHTHIAASNGHSTWAHLSYFSSPYRTISRSLFPVFQVFNSQAVPQPLATPPKVRARIIVEKEENNQPTSRQNPARRTCHGSRQREQTSSNGPEPLTQWFRFDSHLAMNRVLVYVDSPLGQRRRSFSCMAARTNQLPASSRSKYQTLDLRLETHGILDRCCRLAGRGTSRRPERRD